MPKKKTKPRRSGVNIPESQRCTVQLKIRVPHGTVAQLDALVPPESNRSDFVARLIGKAAKRRGIGLSWK